MCQRVVCHPRHPSLTHTLTLSHSLSWLVHVCEQQVEHDAIKREKRRANLQLEEERGQRRKKRTFSNDLEAYVVHIGERCMGMRACVSPLDGTDVVSEYRAGRSKRFIASIESAAF